MKRATLLVVVMAASIAVALFGGARSVDADHPSDGCSVPALVAQILFGGDANQPNGFDFTAACNAHDRCYQTWADSSLDHKRACDQAFDQDLEHVCAPHSGLD